MLPPFPVPVLELEIFPPSSVLAWLRPGLSCRLFPQDWVSVLLYFRHLHEGDRRIHEHLRHCQTLGQCADGTLIVEQHVLRRELHRAAHSCASRIGSDRSLARQRNIISYYLNASSFPVPVLELEIFPPVVSSSVVTPRPILRLFPPDWVSVLTILRHLHEGDRRIHEQSPALPNPWSMR